MFYVYVVKAKNRNRVIMFKGGIRYEEEYVIRKEGKKAGKK